MAQGKLFCGLSHRRFGERLTFLFAAAFNQTERGRQQGGKGTGLGLALVRQIVKLSGGRLGVRSKVGQGSTFWVELRKFKSHPEINCLCGRFTHQRWV
jgi:light-regulated signal transduction histidine kinase (bacteriophytochrome)